MTNSPNAWITFPASPLERMSRVEETLSARRKSVSSSSSAGNELNSSGSVVCSATSSITSERAMEMASIRSSTSPGSGRISRAMTNTTASARPISAVRPCVGSVPEGSAFTLMP